jgi:hypothetical protein
VPDHVQAQRAIAADPSEIFRILTDPQGHIAIDSSGMLMSAAGEPVKGVGDSFAVQMDGKALSDTGAGLYDVTARIVTFEPDREIAWTVEARVNVGHVWGYRLEPIPEGTLATAYYDWSKADESYKSKFPAIPEGTLASTLGILARTVAPGKTRPGA